MDTKTLLIADKKFLRNPVLLLPDIVSCGKIAQLGTPTTFLISKEFRTGI